MVRPVHLVLLFFLLLYLLFPSANSTLDAYYYAACIRYGTDLFLPHHLLYNAVGYAVIQALKSTGLSPDVLHLMKAVNAVAAVACLAVLSRILTILKRPVQHQLAWVALVGSAFGVWRFATENEVYILPLFFSLLASWFWLKSDRSRRGNWLLLAGLMAVIACLFHQVQVFWWLGLLVGVLFEKKSISKGILFALPAILVPLAYSAVLFAIGQPPSFQGLLQFALHDFYSGSAGSEIGLNNFTLTAINLVRTFMQVHGNLAYLLSYGWQWFLPGLISAGLLLWALLSNPFKAGKPIPKPDQLVARIHLLIALLHIGFAWFAVGNAEFLVMIPFLLPLLPLPNPKPGTLAKVAAALLIWNFWYGIYPQWQYKLSATGEFAGLAHKYPNTLFVLDDAIKTANQYYYYFGLENPGNILKSPSARAQRNEDPKVLQEVINAHLDKKKPVVTDCLGKPQVFSRHSMVSSGSDSAFFATYRQLPAFQLTTFYGTQQVIRLQ